MHPPASPRCRGTCTTTVEKGHIMTAISYDSWVSTPARTAAPRTRLRLTRRGRLVTAVLVALPLVIALIGMALNGGGATATSGASTVTTVTVESGQSLWQVASMIAPGSSTADVVSDLISINNLTSASVHPGQQLIVPERYVD